MAAVQDHAGRDLAGQRSLDSSSDAMFRFLTPRFAANEKAGRGSASIVSFLHHSLTTLRLQWPSNVYKDAFRGSAE